MQRAPCPNCGAEIVFRSLALPVVVCDFCRSSVLRDGETLSAMGISATVPDTISPLQIGVRGRHMGSDFELIGRVRWAWSDNGLVMGGWTEWLALFANGSHGWLAEAMGRYMLTHAILPLPGDALVRAVASGENVVPGVLVELAGTSYRVIDARHAEAVGSDGELPFAAPKGERVFSVDLANAAGGCASVQNHGGDLSAHEGRFVTLADLAPTGLRAIEGWTPPGWAA